MEKKMEFVKWIFITAVCVGTLSAHAQPAQSTEDEIVGLIHQALGQSSTIHRNSEGCIGWQNFKLDRVNDFLSSGSTIRGALFKSEVDLKLAHHEVVLEMEGVFVTHGNRAFTVRVRLHQPACASRQVVARITVYLVGEILKDQAFPVR